jgi:hypothetical protein
LVVWADVAVTAHVVPIAPVVRSEKLGALPLIEHPAVPGVVIAYEMSPPPVPPDVVRASAELNGFDSAEVITSAACEDFTIVTVNPALFTLW